MIPANEHPQWHKLPDGVTTCQICEQFFEYHGQVIVPPRCIACRGDAIRIPLRSALSGYSSDQGGVREKKS